MVGIFFCKFEEMKAGEIRFGLGFQGQEGDDEVAGRGNSYTAEYWQYDSRLGRRWNVDPKPNVSISPYACFANNPIIYIDVKGDTIKTSFSNKLHRVAYNLWTKYIKGGKTFAKDYGIAGRYEHITVDLQSGDRNETDLDLVKKDGTSVNENYKSDVNIPNLKEIANGTNKEDGHLVYTVTIGATFNPCSRGYSLAHQIVRIHSIKFLRII